MNVNVRFYWQHDIDLIGLVKRPDFDMAKAIQIAMRAYVRHDQSVRIALPPYLNEPTYLESCVVSVYFSPKEDADVIHFLTSVRYGFRNSLIKNVVRRYLTGLYFEPYNTSSFFEVDRRKPKGAQKKKVTVIHSSSQQKKSIPKESNPIQSSSPSSPILPKPNSSRQIKKRREIQHTVQSSPIPSSPPTSSTSSQPIHPKPQPIPQSKPISSSSQGEDDGFDLFGKIGDIMGSE